MTKVEAQDLAEEMDRLIAEDHVYILIVCEIGENVAPMCIYNCERDLAIEALRKIVDEADGQADPQL